MNTGKSLTGPMSSLIKDAMRKAGVRGNLPTVASPAVGVYIGTVEPLQGDPENSAAARQVLANIGAARMAALQGAGSLGGTAAWNRRAATVALTMPEYLLALKSSRSVMAEFEREAKRTGSEGRYLVPYEKAETYRFLSQIYNPNFHTPSFQGYINYVCAVHSAYVACLNRVSAPVLDEQAREHHTYITGGSGSGKTELMKALALHDIRKGDRSVIIIDPQTNFAGTVARWREFSGENAERLVYFDPALERGFLPGLNPLDASHLTKAERSILAEQLTDVMAQVVTQDTGERWTTQTAIVAQHCFDVALNTRGATLRHLRLALVEPEEKRGHIPRMVAELVRLGKRHHNAEVRDFFEYDFFKPNFASSKNSFSAKLSAGLKNATFSAVTCRPSTIHLENLIDERKVIIFNLGAWGNDVGAGAFGRMVIAQLVALGMRRSTQYGKAHVPVHIYVDEADLFVGPAVLTALSKLRQHRVHMTLAQQVFARRLDGDDKRDILGNTGVKFTTGEDQKEMLAAMHAPADATRGLASGQFIGRWGRKGEVFKTQVRADLLGRANCMTNDEWEEVVSHQLARYYAATAEPGDDYGQESFSGDIIREFGVPEDESEATTDDDGGYEWEEE